MKQIRLRGQKHQPIGGEEVQSPATGNGDAVRAQKGEAGFDQRSRQQKIPCDREDTVGEMEPFQSPDRLACCRRRDAVPPGIPLVPDEVVKNGRFHRERGGERIGKGKASGQEKESGGLNARAQKTHGAEGDCTRTSAPAPHRRGSSR